jgi:nucleoid-associated protein YgaU
MANPTPGLTTGEQYVIAKGDGLGKITAHFYKSNTAENRQRIIAANPGIMKDGQPFLIAGKTLIIPGAAATTPTVARSAAQPVTLKVDSRKPAGPGVVIGLPGSGKTSDKVAEKAATPAKAPAPVAEAKIYVVKDGDTLTKIAKKIDAAHYPAVMKKIEAANGISDPKAIQPGDSLKLPL